MPIIKSVSKFQKEIFKLLEDVCSGDELVIVTKKGKDAAVLIGYD